MQPFGGANSSSTEDDVLIRCNNVACSNVVLVPRQARRFCHACPCGSRPFCTICKEPYHFHGDCGNLQDLRQRWLRWITVDRRHFQASRIAANVYDAQVEALEDSINRRREFEHDERWKEMHCRLCPGCQRSVEKTEGCDSMLCGQDAHGGNQQSGCGIRFKWSEAVPYVFNGHSVSPIRGVTAEEVRCRGRDTLHPFVHCSLCGSSGIGIIGPRFRCLHCLDFSVCLECEPHLAARHEADHVFEIMFESEFRWRELCLPIGTLVHTVHYGGVAPWGFSGSYPNSTPTQLVGVCGQIVAFVENPGRRYRKIPWGYTVLTSGHEQKRYDVLAEHLEPVLKDDAEAESLIQEALRVGPERRQELRQQSRWRIWQSDCSVRLKAWRDELFDDD